MAQYGFYHNMNECSGCKSCVLACKDVRNLEVGYNYRHVTDFEGGTYLAGIWAGSLSMSCNHCATPACIPACSVGAIVKDEDTGLVSIDTALCIGCLACTTACPYEAPVFLSDEGIVDKCDGCAAQRAMDQLPACVATCNMRCLDFGELEDLKKKYGTGLVNEVSGIPAASQTGPSILINPKEQLRV